MSTSASNVKVPVKRPKTRRVEVPVAQLYRDIERGYQFFMARKMKQDTLHHGKTK